MKHRVNAKTVAYATVCLCGLPTLLGYLGALWWAFDLLAQFRVHLAFVSIAVCLLTLLVRLWPAFAVAVVLLGLNIAPITPSFFGSPATGSPALSILSSNVFSANTQFDRLLEEVRQRQPDVLVVMEVSPRWEEALRRGLSGYEMAAVEARSDNFGIALMTRVPCEAEIVHLLPDGPPSVVARFDRDGRELLVLATHTLPPVNREYASRRDAQLGAIADWVLQAGSAVVVVGDLNTAPWGSGFAPLEDAGLTDTGEGFGLHATWPTRLGPLGLPIDHCLTTAALGASRREVLQDVGSDHFPIAVELVWREPVN